MTLVHFWEDVHPLGLESSVKLGFLSWAVVPAPKVGRPKKKAAPVVAAQAGGSGQRL